MSIHLFCLPRKKSLNLQVEIILAIISVITLHSLIGLKCSIFWIQHLSDFPGLLSWLSFHIWFFFQHNLVCFNFVQASNSPESWFDIVWWPNCFVRASLMGILFCIIHCTPEVYIYCSKLSAATRVIALQVVRTSFLAPRPCYFPLPPLVLTLYV